MKKEFLKISFACLSAMGCLISGCTSDSSSKERDSSGDVTVINLPEIVSIAEEFTLGDTKYRESYLNPGDKEYDALRKDKIIGYLIDKDYYDDFPKQENYLYGKTGSMELPNDKHYVTVYSILGIDYHEKILVDPWGGDLILYIRVADDAQ